MTPAFAVITPAFAAEETIVHAAKSVLCQTFADWEWVVVSDDGRDYQAFLANDGIADPRFRFLRSEAIRSGASRARNVALDHIEAPYAAILDADDCFHPEKLARCAAALEQAAIVTTGLNVVDEAGRHLRYVALGPDRLLRPAMHKWTSLSMDSMIAWDRRRTDARYDPVQTNMTDLDLLLKLYRRSPRSMHLGAPLHDYVKRTQSMSNGPGVTEKMIASKRVMLGRLDDGYYGLDAADTAGIRAFLEISLVAEASYPAAMAAHPGLLFEDHIEPMLRARGGHHPEHFPDD